MKILKLSKSDIVTAVYLGFVYALFTSIFILAMIFFLPEDLLTRLNTVVTAMVFLVTAFTAWFARKSAHSAEKSAKSAEQSANQWREQKHQDLATTSILEALQAAATWHSYITFNRDSLNGGKVTEYQDFYKWYRQGSEEYWEVLLEARAKESYKLFTEMKSKIEKCRLLGYYDQKMVNNLITLNTRYLTAATNLRPSSVNRFQKDTILEFALDAFELNSENNSFTSELSEHYLGFENHYKNFYWSLVQHTNAHTAQQ
ncbi:hypothetical protein MSG37_00940 [Shewanella sp. 1CM18E]|uniref:hypothetical protein n=1 Tax=Shewanella sp. 1CM18E TaxID=2929169 RepID=UPI0020BF6FA7|nr:hypothetical protein [Shewanella sp. 1CM18E]MCK8043438.1 hypothetical protein [Shewanella sp. 1CM18E]